MFSVQKEYMHSQKQFELNIQRHKWEDSSSTAIFSMTQMTFSIRSLMVLDKGTTHKTCELISKHQVVTGDQVSYTSTTSNSSNHRNHDFGNFLKSDATQKFWLSTAGSNFHRLLLQNFVIRYKAVIWHFVPTRRCNKNRTNKTYPMVYSSNSVLQCQ